MQDKFIDFYKITFLVINDRRYIILIISIKQYSEINIFFTYNQIYLIILLDLIK